MHLRQDRTKSNLATTNELSNLGASSLKNYLFGIVNDAVFTSLIDKMTEKDTASDEGGAIRNAVSTSALISSSLVENKLVSTEDVII